jgi:lipopolysaccharide biosynthesis glycosyltransferase
MPSECALCYATDLNFLLPSLVSAAQIRRYVSSDQCGIFIFVLDNSDIVDRIKPLSERLNISVKLMSSDLYKELDAKNFVQTGLPMSAVARFFLADLLPGYIKRIVYLDGDTWISSDPSSLLQAEPPEGRLAAVEDSLSFQRRTFSHLYKSYSSYLNGLGLQEKNSYFNSGLIVVTRKTWVTLSLEAFQFLKNNTSACKFHDQSALNAVVRDRRLPLSTKWNFQTPLKRLKLDKVVKPKILHFTRYPKPWMAPVSPWKEMFSLYQSEMQPFATLNLPLKQLAQFEEKDSWKAKVSDSLSLLPRLTAEALGIMAYEQRAWL